jgi:hypothetical protein
MTTIDESKKSEKWKKSFEDVYDNLKLITRCHAEEEDIILICDTLLELPKNVRDKTLKEVIFLVISDKLYGFFTIIRLSKLYIDCTKQINEKLGHNIVYIKQPLIVLDFSRMRNFSIPLKMSNVAHEVAHFVLGYNDEVMESDSEAERKADDLVEKWGFKRVYTESDYKSFEKGSHKQYD